MSSKDTSINLTYNMIQTKNNQSHEAGYGSAQERAGDFFFQSKKESI